jgi:hypothetical protein
VVLSMVSTNVLREPAQTKIGCGGGVQGCKQLSEVAIADPGGVSRMGLCVVPKAVHCLQIQSFRAAMPFLRKFVLGNQVLCRPRFKACTPPLGACACYASGRANLPAGVLGMGGEGGGAERSSDASQVPWERHPSLGPAGLGCPRSLCVLIKRWSPRQQLATVAGVFLAALGQWPVVLLLMGLPHGY